MQVSIACSPSATEANRIRIAAWEDHRDARAEGSDNFEKACAESLATKKAMRDRFPDYQSRYKLRYP